MSLCAVLATVDQACTTEDEVDAFNLLLGSIVNGDPNLQDAAAEFSREMGYEVG